jgi:transcriptional regulator with XRE-family HTH domain
MAFVKVIRTYNWVDKDPVCDEMMMLVKDAGLQGPKHTGKIAILATLSKSTVDNLLYGKTRKPQNNTIMAIATSLGYERTWKRSGSKWDLEKELEEARAFVATQRKMAEAARERAGKREKAKRKAKRERVRVKPSLRLVS